MENYEDFSRATEFQKYIREPGHPNQNQIIPEACCKLKEDKDLKYFEPKDPNCIEVPTVTNSYYTNVSFIVQINIYHECSQFHKNFRENDFTEKIQSFLK